MFINGTPTDWKRNRVTCVSRNRLAAVCCFVKSLALAPLRGLAGLLEAWLLALLRARVALEEGRCLEHLAGVRLCLDECASDGVAHRVCLSGDAAALDVRVHLVVLSALSLGERLDCDEGAQISLEIVLGALAVHHE